MGDELVRLEGAAQILGMSSSNVGKFLERRGVLPAVATPYRRRWSRAVIQAVADEYETSRKGRRSPQAASQDG